MDYYSLSLAGEGVVEECLGALRVICNPQSKNPPHITVRTVEHPHTSGLAFEYTERVNIKHISIVGPDMFPEPFEQSPAEGVPRPPYTVVLRCESEELEAREYKADYPYSYLHITIYEGADYGFARDLLGLLGKYGWNLRLSFTNKGLQRQTVGGKKPVSRDYNARVDDLLKTRLGIGSRSDLVSTGLTNKDRLALVERVLDVLDAYGAKHVRRSESGYSASSRAELRRKIVSESETVGLCFFDSQKREWVHGRPEEPFYAIGNEKAFLTPPEYAEEMARSALEAVGRDFREIDFGDSSVGTGVLFSALDLLVRDRDSYTLRSAMGIDINLNMAVEARYRLEKRSLVAYWGDALSPNADLPQRNLMLVNPPYAKASQIHSRAYKAELHDLAERQTGISLHRDAGLYAYHLLIMDKWLVDGGVAVWLLPISFLYTRYGRGVRQYLTQNVRLVRIHLYDPETVQFDKAKVSVALVVFKKARAGGADGAEGDKGTGRSEGAEGSEGTGRDNGTGRAGVRVTWGESAARPEHSEEIYAAALGSDSWGWLLNRLPLRGGGTTERGVRNGGATEHGAREGGTTEHGAESRLTFQDLFDIKRGIATGANSFFTMTPDEAREIGIPEEATKPLLPKSRYLTSPVIEADEAGRPVGIPWRVLVDCDMDEETIRRLYPGFYEYLQTAKQSRDGGTPVVERALVRRRHPWYKQERRDPPMFLLTYMGRRSRADAPYVAPRDERRDSQPQFNEGASRDESRDAPLRFIWNRSRAVALNTYILLYPRPWLRDLMWGDPRLTGKVWDALNRTAESVVAASARLYAGGLSKIEPGELKVLHLVGLPPEVEGACDHPGTFLG